ncbi:uncharacterized protein LOC128306613 [Anopheles moucheti]|uniref:uncharacterized protein LOC128306613 n=1 Tax=Anopheles moucheti TaxID=186751 RepID=UPI0022F00555|nr:uncharacterized protein LOC128306613 [Anopheles moucheti]
MMMQCISENFTRSTHTITVKTAIPRQMLPMKKLNIRNAEWTFCSSFHRGEVSIALMLDYYKEKWSGLWAGLHGEIVNNNGYVMSNMTKMYFIQPGEALYLKMRLFPETYYKRRSSNDRGHLPKGCFHVRVTTTLAYRFSSTHLENFLANNKTILQSVQWPMLGERVVSWEPDCTIAFRDGKEYYVNRAALLETLDPRSPFHDWNNRFPERQVFCPDMVSPEIGQTMSLFVQLSCTNYIPWRNIEFPVLIELLKLATYFQYDRLQKLCGVQLIHMLLDGTVTMSMLWRLAQLELSFINQIINCYQVTNMVRPEIGSLSSIEQDAT